MAKPERDPLTGQWTTGHSWDGIRELKTPVPLWWVSAFLISVAFAIGYVLLYPSFPSPGGQVHALSNASTRTTLEQQREAAKLQLAGMTTAILDRPVEELSRDEELARFAFNGGRALYLVHCIACHGPGAAGQAGQFPALVDDDWLWGGSKTDIHQTIRYGIRNDHPDSRQSMMPAFGELLSAKEIDAVAAYVTLIGGVPATSPRRAAHPGHAIFQQQCAACHGPDGRGNIDFGAPNLTDAVWLYGSRPEDIRQQILAPRMGMMPNFNTRLTDTEIKMLTVYVHGLGGGQPPRLAEPAATTEVAAEPAGGEPATGQPG